MLNQFWFSWYSSSKLLSPVGPYSRVPRIWKRETKTITSIFLSSVTYYFANHRREQSFYDRWSHAPPPQWNFNPTTKNRATFFMHVFSLFGEWEKSLALIFSLARWSDSWFDFDFLIDSFVHSFFDSSTAASTKQISLTSHKRDLAHPSICD